MISSRAAIVALSTVVALGLGACSDDSGREAANQIRDTLNRANARWEQDPAAPGRPNDPSVVAAPATPDEVAPTPDDDIATPVTPNPDATGGDGQDPVPLCRKADPPCLNADGLLIEP